MKQDFATIGSELKQKRMEKNLSLREVQNATSIQLSHLQALEDGDMKKLISPVYAQGFLKQYAKYLGIDGDQIVRDNPELFVVKDKQHFDYGIGTVEKRGNHGSSGKGASGIAWGAAFAAILILAYVIARYFEVV